MSQKIDFQLMLRKIWKTHDDNSTFLSESLKGWGPRCWGPDSSLLREKLGVLSLILTVFCCAGGRVYGKSIPAFPTHSDVGIFLFTWCIGVTDLVSGFLSEAIAAYVVPCVWKEVSSGASYAAILYQNLPPTWRWSTRCCQEHLPSSS